MSWPVGVALGTHVEVVGIEDDPDGGLRVYIKARHLGLYVVIEDEPSIEAVRRAWNGATGHVTMPMPPQEHIFQEPR